MELHLWTAEEDLDAIFSLYHRRVGPWGGRSVPLESAVRANNRMDMLCDCGIRVESGCMIVTPVDHGLDLLASDLVRSSGTHASDIYGSFYEEAEPSRYRRDTPPEPLLLALGTAWEKHLEYLLIKNGIRAERPEEQMSPEGVAFSPDLIIFNGVTKLGELKLTFQSSRDYPTTITNSLPPKADKWLTQMMLYAYWLNLHDGWLCVAFLGDRPLTRSSLRVFELQWSDRELQENYQMMMNQRQLRGL